MSDGRSHGLDHTKKLRNEVHGFPYEPVLQKPTMTGEAKENWIHYFVVRKQMLALKYYDHNSRSYDFVFSDENELTVLLLDEILAGRLRYDKDTNCYNEPDIIGLIYRLKKDPESVG